MKKPHGKVLDKSKKSSTIALRTKDNWKYGVDNKGKYTCDQCGSKLFKAPHGGTYCDSVH